MVFNLKDFGLWFELPTELNELFWWSFRSNRYPCLVHTESRRYDWVVFRRQPDRTPTLYYDVEWTESEDGDNEQDEDYFSVEPVDIDEEEEDQTNCEMNSDVTGAASSTNEDLTNGLDETPKESGPGDIQM